MATVIGGVNRDDELSVLRGATFGVPLLAQVVGWDRPSTPACVGTWMRDQSWSFRSQIFLPASCISDIGLPQRSSDPFPVGVSGPMSLRTLHRAEDLAITGGGV